MRDKKRIPEILNLIETIWDKDQDMRFLQLIYNLQRNYSQSHNGLGKVEHKEKDGFTTTGYDLFNLEDDELIDFLKDLLK